MARVLLLLPTHTYRNADFLAAARRLGLAVTVASEEPSTLEALAPDALLTLDLHDPALATERALAFARRYEVDAVLGVDEATVLVAAHVAGALGLAHHSVASAHAAKDKSRMRALLHEHGVRAPAFEVLPIDAAPAWTERARYPCVVKPLALSASRGVMRADDPAAARACQQRLAAILAEPEIAQREDPLNRKFLVEEFVPGVEVAVEGIVTAGRLTVLALFDKPDPLDGPFFAETIYVTPSRLPPDAAAVITGATQAATRALGLAHGPIHAELRHGARGAYVIEVAGRSIGGLCSRVLRFGLDQSLEELVLRHALGLSLRMPEREGAAAGVLMLPVTEAGRLEAVHGVDAAREVPAVTEVTVTAHPGQLLRPLPEGNVYLGFVFARAATPEEVVLGLRQAHACLRVAVR